MECLSSCTALHFKISTEIKFNVFQLRLLLFTFIMTTNGVKRRLTIKKLFSDADDANYWRHKKKNEILTRTEICAY